MRLFRWIAGVICAVVLLWWLAPERSRLVKNGEIVEITFLGLGGPTSGPLDDVVRAFERWSDERHRKDPSHPAYRVISGQNAVTDHTADPTRFLISVAGGEPPDVICFARSALAEWSGRGAFASLDSLIARDQAEGLDDAVRREDYYPNVWSEACYEGKVYGIPNSVDDRALIYNRDMLKRAGLVDPATGEARPPRTWEELREYGRKLTRRDAFGKLQTIGFAPNYGNSWLYIYGWLAGGEFMSPDGRHCTLNSPEIVRALEYMVDTYKDLGGYDVVQAIQSGFAGGDLDPFITGQVAMKIDLSDAVGYLAQFGRDLDFAVAPAPAPADMVAKGAPPVSWSGGWAYSIPANARNREAGWEFIRFACSDKGLRVLAESQNEAADAMGFPFIPGFTPKPRLNDELLNRYVFTSPKVQERVKDAVREFQRLLPYSRFRPVTPVGQLLWSQHVSAMEEACYLRKSPKQALDYATAVVQRDLDRFYTPAQGVRIRPEWFSSSYLVLLALAAFGVYRWDTSARLRRRVLGLFGRRSSVGEGDVVEGSRGGYFRSQWLPGLLCASPWLVGFIIFGGGPLLFSVVMSFCDYDVFGAPRFIGLKNYRVMFMEDEIAPKAFYNTLFMLLGIPVSLVAGLAVALLLNLGVRGMKVFRTLFYLPVVVPAVATYMLWIWVFNPISGPLNSLLETFGIAGKSWLMDEHWAKPSIIFMGLWGVGGGMIIWLAGLQNINVQLYEAASIDGASAYHRFRYITLPQLSPYIFFNLIMGLIVGFQIFDEAFVMTRGGPVNATTFYVYHIFNNAFRYGHMGYACALAWVLFVCILGLTILQLRFARRWVHYETE